MNVDVDELREVLDEIKTDGRTYVKTRQVACEMDHTAKEIAAGMVALENRDEVERWSTCSPTTWKILQ